MAPTLLFMLALLAADPAQASDTPAAAQEAPWPTGAPHNDYGLVAWCYGALTAHMKLHDTAMPEVERIERTWESTPGSADAALADYEEQRIEGVRAIAQFRRAMEAAEKASVKPIQEQGAAAIKSGAAIWTGAAAADKRRLAQEWMSWALPGRCVPTAQALEKKASLFGQALNYNVGETPPPAEEKAAPAEEISAEAIGLRPAEADAPLEAETVEPEAEAEPAEAVEEAAPEPEPEATVEAPAPVEDSEATPESTPEPAADFVIDMDAPQPCPGRLEPETRDGADVLVCKVEQ